jgi:hypothetical protein
LAGEDVAAGGASRCRSIVPDAFAAFAFVKANGFTAADVEKLKDQARGDRGTLRAAALHRLNFTHRRIFFPGIRPHCGFALAGRLWETNQKPIRNELGRESKVWR